jgi:uncharacterized UBP type Zn finger protein
MRYYIILKNYLAGYYIGAINSFNPTYLYAVLKSLFSTIVIVWRVSKFAVLAIVNYGDEYMKWAVSDILLSNLTILDNNLYESAL